MGQKADEAFLRARKRIAEAKRHGWVKLDLAGPEFQDLEALPGEIAGLTELTSLDLSGSGVSDVSPLSGLTGLTALDISNTEVRDVSGIGSLIGLTQFNLASTGVKDLSALSGMRSLQFLDLRDTQVRKETLARVLAGKPRLIPSEAHNALAGQRGVAFAGSDVARGSLELARIAEITVDRGRTLWLFRNLGVDLGEAEIQSQTVELPPRRPAPLEVEMSDTAIRLSGSPGLPASDANARAAMGWEALKEFRDNLANGFAIHNYQPLPRRLEDFDRAMGQAYDPRNVVRIWSQGLRIQQLANDTEFLSMLPVGVPDDLKGFAAAIALYAERFPDVVAYRDDVSPDDRSPANVYAGAAEFKAIEAILSQMPEAELVVKEEYRAEVEAGTGEKSDAEASRAVVASTGELMRETAEKAQQKRNRDLARKGGDLVEDWTTKPFGLPYHLAMKLEKPMRALSKRFPNRMGWVVKWYDLTFGPEDDRPEAGAL